MPPRKPKADRKAPEAKKPKTTKAKSTGSRKTAHPKPVQAEVAAQPTVNKVGRKTDYDPTIAQEILDLLAEGKTLLAICRDNRFPNDRTVRRWAMDPKHEFSEPYRIAREVGYHALADEVITIGDDVPSSAAAVAKARLRVDTRKWVIAKMLPKIYGDKVALTDADGGKLIIEFAV